MAPWTWMLLATGLTLLLGGAELLVRGASQLAARFRVPPLIIGLTVVAYGTSAPELAVSLQAAAAGQADIAVGNVLGSNVFNVLFILGVTALIVPLKVTTNLVRLDVPIMIGASFLLAILAWDGRVDPLEGALLLGAGLAYTCFLVVEGRREGRSAAARDEAAGVEAKPGRNALLSVLLALVGLATLIVGSRWLVRGAVVLAQALGVGELVIGLTVVAVGTSLPEVATSFVAALRGERDIAVGNVVGSNIFNILWVLGAAAVSSGGLAVSAQARALDIPVMVAVAVICLPIFFTGYMISRPEGALFFGYYAAYTAYLLLASSGSTALPTVESVFKIAVPLTVIALLGFLVHSSRRPGVTPVD
jgi:cation:H+ antiporter